MNRFKKSRVKIYNQLSEYQQQQVDAEVPLVWEAIDENYNSLFESLDLHKVIEFSNKNQKVSHITKHTDYFNRIKFLK